MKKSKSPNRIQVVEMFSRSAFGLSCWLAVLLFIEMTPKDPAARNTLRLAYMVAFFLAAIGLCLHVQRTIPRFLLTLYRWRYEDAPPEMENSMKNFTEEVDFVLLVMTALCVFFLGAMGMTVLNHWFPLPSLINGMVSLVWWGTVIGMVLFVYCLPVLLNNVLRHLRFLRRQTRTCDFYRPRKLSNLWQLKPSDPDRPFELRPPKDGFVIGRRPWRLSKLRENMIVFGSVGSGKTLCVMNAFLENLIASKGSRDPIGGLILDYKGDFYQKTVRLCQKHGRRDDLIVLSPDSGNAWNPVDNVEPANEIAARFVATMKALGQKDRNTSFFGDQAETLLANAIVLLRQSNSPDDPPMIADIYRIANDFDFLQERLEALPDHAPNAPLSNPLFRCKYYFEQEFYALPDEVRQSVVATLNNMLNPLCTEKIAAIIHKPSTVDLADCAKNAKIVYLHLPAAQTPKAGRVLGLLLKLAFFAEVKKKALDCQRYSFLFADEFQEFFTSEGEASDARFFAISRQYDQINLIATQNLNNFTMLGDKKDAVKSFLSNVKTKVFLQNSDKDTNDYATELFGQYVAELGGSHNGSIPQLLSHVRSTDFIGLRSPEVGQCDYCESFILNEAASKVDIANRTARWPVHVI